MKLLFFSVSRDRAEWYETAFAIYLKRSRLFAETESSSFSSEAALMASVERRRSQVAPLLVLLDSRGRSLSSEAFAAWIGKQRDGGVQNLIFAIGPADGWSERARERAGLLLSLGPMTLPHELARVVLAEQVYRAFTILANHPYHGGH
jgi:23S rRNA (pseudouridine1915-N3)-methyltransferase